MGICRSQSHKDHENGVRNECWELECRRNKTYCESKSSQVEHDEEYRPDMTLFPVTCSEVSRHFQSANMHRGECGKWHESGDWFETLCHDSLCKTEAGCEAKGFQFKALSQSEAEDRSIQLSKHYFDSESASSWGICCNGPANLLQNSTRNYPYTSAPFPEGYVVEETKTTCSKCECCGEGTRCKDGACYPTYDGAMEVCKKVRGEKWGWTCDGEAQCSGNVNTRRLQRKSKPRMRWPKGWHATKPTTGRYVPSHRRGRR